MSKEPWEIVWNGSFEQLRNPRLQATLNLTPFETSDQGTDLGFAKWEGFTGVKPKVGSM